MCSCGQCLLSSPGLSETWGCDAAPWGVSVLAWRRGEGAWGCAGGSLPSPPGGCMADGAPPELL